MDALRHTAGRVSLFGMRVGRRTLRTRNCAPFKTGAALFRNNPRSQSPRRIVTHVKGMTAFQFGDPFAAIVLSEIHNPSAVAHTHTFLFGRLCFSAPRRSLPFADTETQPGRVMILK
jgi:hypothetical protein